MFSRILVPLDGSRLAESVLPTVYFLAQKTKATITLIHVIEKNAPEEIHGEHHLTDPEEANQYLSNLASKMFSDMPVEKHVHTTEVSNVARSIVDHADEMAPDLIIMCTHGRGGLHDFLLGSIAQQVIAMGKTPVLLIHPVENDGGVPFECKQILVPMDAIPDHEAALPIVTALALLCQSNVLLLFVVPTLGTLSGQPAVTGKLLPGTTAVMLELAEENAQKYLRGHALSLRSKGVPVKYEVSRGDPAEKIIEISAASNTDLIILATHGKIGQDAFWAGSVAPRVAGSSHIPLLLVPIQEPNK